MVHVALKALPKHNTPKSPTVAMMIGFLFGPIGLGIYFKTFWDFLIPLFLLIVLGTIIPGLGLIPGWIFSAVFGYFRAESNH